MNLSDFHSRLIVNPDTGCHEWRGATTTAGYGHLRHQGESVYAHRLAYELAHGPIGLGLVIDHLCRIRHCANPAHLEAVAQVENVRRGAVPLRARCKRGHDVTRAENVRIDRRGHRHCRPCEAISKRRRRAA